MLTCPCSRTVAPHRAEVVFHWARAGSPAHYPVCLPYAKFLRGTFTPMPELPPVNHDV